MTPAELAAVARADLQRRRAKREEKNADLYLLASMIAGFVWTDGEKRPKYEDIFHAEKKKQAMTDAQLFATVRAINAAMGGKELGSFDCSRE